MHNYIHKCTYKQAYIRKIFVCCVAMLFMLGHQEAINAQLISIKQQNKVIYGYEGDTISFKTPSKKYKVKWTSSNKQVATVSLSGKVKLKSVGDAWISAKWGKSCVKRKIVVSSPYVYSDKETLDVNERIECRLVGATVVEWKVSDTSVASITKQGVLSGHKTGTVEVYAKVKNKRVYTKKIEVYNSQRMQGLLADKKLISHRGYNIEAPENTMSAFQKSFEYGYKYIETDVTFTSDGVPVILHDDRVDRTSNGLGNIRDLTFSYVRSLDFGSWKSDEYKGEKIPTFDEFMQFCSTHDIHPYVELKSNITQERVEQLIDIIDQYDMRKKVSWVSFNCNYLEYVKNMDDGMELGINLCEVNSSSFYWVNRLKTDNNVVFLSLEKSCLNDAIVQKCKNNDIPIGLWCYESRDEIISVDSYVSVITTNGVKLDQ